MTTCDDGDASREGWGWEFLFSFFSHTRGCQNVSIVWRVCVCACVVSIDKFLMLIGIIQIDRSTNLEVYIISEKCIISSMYQHSVQSVQVTPTLIPFCGMLFRIRMTLNGVKCLVTIEVCHPRSCRRMSTTWTRPPSAWKSLMGVMTKSTTGS